MAKKKDKAKDKSKDKKKKKEKILESTEKAIVDSVETKVIKKKKKKKKTAAEVENTKKKAKATKVETAKKKKKKDAADLMPEEKATKKAVRKKATKVKKSDDTSVVAKPAVKKDKKAGANKEKAKASEKASTETEKPAERSSVEPSLADTDLLLAISQVYRLSTQELQTALKEKDISASQWEILAALSSDLPVTQQELARLLFVSEGNITQMLSKMEKLGWIERKREWRTNYVTLSAAGDALKKSVESIYQGVNDQFFADLTEDEQADFQRLLSTLIAEPVSEN